MNRCAIKRIRWFRSVLFLTDPWINGIYARVSHRGNEHEYDVENTETNYLNSVDHEYCKTNFSVAKPE